MLVLNDSNCIGVSNHIHKHYVIVSSLYGNVTKSSIENICLIFQIITPLLLK